MARIGIGQHGCSNLCQSDSGYFDIRHLFPHHASRKQSRNAQWKVHPILSPPCSRNAMPIPVTCSCGSSFAAPDNLAGKTVQCPKCKNPLAIPNPAAAAAANSIFDDAGMKGLEAGQMRCPSCEASISSDSVLCVKCGYHIKLGKKLAAPKAAAAGGHGGDAHAATAEDMLERARATIEADKVAKENEMNEGSSFWSILAVFLYATGFLVMMLYLKGSQAFNAGGALIVLTGILGIAYCIVRIAMVGFEENLLHGFMSVVLFIVYPIMKWSKCGPYYLTMLGCGALVLVGGGMFWIAGILAENEKSDEDFGPKGKGSQVIPAVQNEMYARKTLLNGESFV
jgi:hypothetical protein